MAEIDDELMARVLQWCAEAGHPSSPAEVRDALSSLSWDALLAVRAVLADPPPTRPLGPAALADIARGTAPEIAAQRERDREPGAQVADSGATGEEGAAPSPPPAARAPETKKARGKATRRIATVVIRRARDRREDDTPGDAPPPLVDDLFLSEGRAVLERWVRRHGARRARLVEELSAWRRPDGSPPGDDDLTRLLDAHGLTRPFERREREEILHAVRASGGTLAGAAHALGISTDALAASTERVGIATEVERIRDERRDDIRRRATLGDRVRLLVDEADRIEDLGMTGEIEADVRDRLREHLKALRAGNARYVAPSFARTLGITRDQASSVAARFGIDLRDPPSATGAPWQESPTAPRPASHGSPRPQRESRGGRDARPPPRARGNERPPARGNRGDPRQPSREGHGDPRQRSGPSHGAPRQRPGASHGDPRQRSGASPGGPRQRSATSHGAPRQRSFERRGGPRDATPQGGGGQRQPGRDAPRRPLDRGGKRGGGARPQGPARGGTAPRRDPSRPRKPPRR